MKLLSAQDVRALDQKAIEEYGVPGVVLMENAGRAAAESIKAFLEREDRLSLVSTERPVVVFAGPGNNGGDGYVIARHLINWGIPTRVLLCVESEHIKGDALVNYNILEKMSEDIHPCHSWEDLETWLLGLERCPLIVDALLGTGLRRDVSGWFLDLLDYLNDLSYPLKVACDIPSGLDADKGLPRPRCFHADLTHTFAFAKTGLMLPPAVPYVGELEVIDIGMPKPLNDTVQPVCTCLESSKLRALWKQRSFNSHKGSYGHLLVVAGSPGKSGAALLTATSALRSGLGLCTLGTEFEVARHLGARILEIMCEPISLPSQGDLGEDSADKVLALASGKSAIALGPGLSQSLERRAFAAKILRESSLPIVVDADGLNLLVGQGDILKERSAPTILTPHPGEMARLAGVTSREIQTDRVSYALSFAQEHGVHLVLKGARTLIAEPDGCLWMNTTGHSGLATAGSGDVLTGMIGAFLAKGYPAGEAACLGVHLHGAVADLLLKTHGQSGLIASDLLHGLPTLLKEWD